MPGSLKANDPVLFMQLSELGFSKEFCVICEITGFHSLADLLERHTSEMLKLPGFNYHLLAEFIGFLEAKKLGAYVDAA
jgi:hypothetical protein